MDATAWVALGGCAVTFVGTLLAQTLFWGVFKGTVQAQIIGITTAIEDSKHDRSMLWGRIDDYGPRIVGLETACNLRHPSSTLHDDHEHKP